jgi:hypothetical protein
MKSIIAVIALGLCVTSSTAFAKGDPCKTIICLGGMLTGDSGGSECNDAITPYFDIQVWKKGKFKASKTADKRKDYLNGCKAEDGGYKKKIGDKWGGKLGM